MRAKDRESYEVVVPAGLGDRVLSVHRTFAAAHVASAKARGWSNVRVVRVAPDGQRVTVDSRIC